MALRSLLLRAKIDAKKKELEEMEAKLAGIIERHAELETAIGEVDDSTTEEDLATLEEQVDAAVKEKEEAEEEKKKLEDQITGLEEELETEVARSKDLGAPPKPKQKPEERTVKESGTMAKRIKDMNIMEREAFLRDEGVKKFLGDVRTCIREKRDIGNEGLTIPEVMLPLIRQAILDSSKLVKHVFLSRINGTSRQVIMGEIPEAFWDEMTAAVKELDLMFYGMEMDGYKVSGYYAVSNSILEDSDLDLAEELIRSIGGSIAKAVDKSIIYGSGIKMPTGIVTSLVKTTAPDGYPDNGRPWEDLTGTHIITGANATGDNLFKDYIKAIGEIDNKYGTNTLVHCMNKKTHMRILSESIGKNSNAAIVAGGAEGTMPVVGGAIEDFDFIPDDVIVFGYFENYRLVERAGVKLATSEHARFIEDQTVMKGTGRYDGKPAIREAFGVYGVGAAPDTTAPKFAGQK